VKGSFTIRGATATDVDGIREVDTQVVGMTQSREEEIVTAAIATNDCLVCTDQSDAVVGYVILTRKAFFGRDFVRLLEVSKRHRRVGVATALLAGALAQCTTDTVFISTNESNAAMRSLLANDEWRLSGSLTGIDEGDSEFVYWKQPNEHTK
jgi:ribosomal protein S18 acetylase RimI-like enzyme